MRTPILLASVLVLSVLVLSAGPTAAGDGVEPALRHELEVRLEPAAHRISVTDRVAFLDGFEPGSEAGAKGVPFRLHAGLTPESGDEHWVVEPAEGSVPAHVRTWRLRPASGTWPDAAIATLRYGGTIHAPPESESEEYARAFSRTRGTIQEEGVFLSGASYWVPDFGAGLLGFQLQVELPTGWHAVSQGARTDVVEDTERSLVSWHSPEPMEEVYLVANQWTAYERPAGTATAMAFLRAPDEGLAERYLEATAQYLEMYGRLIGPYPFDKFALVENFWDTGYGMPSFTLLGPRVIRMPFILHSSYPHEILHNWWGNSVYVDWATGNWCEGLTAYLADHLIREGQGRGTDYRFNTLKKYRSYVHAGRDMPLTEFRSRHSGATQAVGYGKCLMLFHMLRRRLGDEVFTRGIQRFFREQQWQRASFSDVERAFSGVAGEELGPWFGQWVERTGAPALEMGVRPGAANEVIVTIRQAHEGDAYRLVVPVAITLKGVKQALVVPVELTERVQEVAIPVPGQPVRVDLDPEFDVFRRLDGAETPPTLSDLFGAAAVTLVVPAPAHDPLAEAWLAFADQWAHTGSGQAVVVQDDALDELPADRAVWVLGSGNVWQRALQERLSVRRAGASEASLEFGETRTARANHCFVYAVRHPSNPALALGWVGADSAAALPGLARKLPHYGKYSYLAFTGKAPDNVVKGQWSVLDSPLCVVLESGEDGAAPPRGALAVRRPLARLSPMFDASRLRDHVAYLADDRLEGRGVGTAGLETAAEYVVAAFRAAGLTAGGDDGSWFQSFQVEGGPDGEPVTLKNVVGVLPGSKEALARQSVVIGAHYDHLGRGWPDVRDGNQGEIHNGADDNASGVAVLLELARVLGRTHHPDRSLVFVAFTGEEWERKGSKHYVETMKRWPVREAHAMVNLDTVGRLGPGKLQILGAGTATEWRHIARGVEYTTGVRTNCVPEDPQGSDQVSFQEVGVPAVQLFTGAHTDYHRPTDDVAKIDAEGLVKVATFLRETVLYLGKRPQPLTSTLDATAPRDPVPGAPAPRRASLGTVPNFAHAGPGVKVDAVVEGSAAEAAGVKAGDLLLAVDGVELQSLRQYAEVLRGHGPGDRVVLTIRRGDESIELEAVLKAR